VLYLVDLSEQCGYALEQQAALFHSLKPLFANKPVIIVANKTDVRSFESLSDEQQSLIEGMASEALRLSHGGVTVSGGAGASEATLLFMSTLQGACSVPFISLKCPCCCVHE
jgi:nucleolar GTP-binding protein